MVTLQAIRWLARITPEHDDVIHQIGGIKDFPGCLVDQGYERVSAFLQLHQRKVSL